MLLSIPLEIQTGSYTPIKDLLIKRSEWVHGRGSNTSALLLDNGMKCCLGFYALACGYSPEVIRNKANLGYWQTEFTAETRWLGYFSRKVWDIGEGQGQINYELAYINDILGTPESIREQIIRDYFMQYGNVRVTFVD